MRVYDSFVSDSEISFFQGLGKRISHARREASLTQVELAESLETTQSVIASYESGRRRMPVSHLVKIADSLGVSVEHLLGRDEAPKGKPGPTPKLQRQFEAITELPKSDQRFFSAMIERFLSESTAKAS